MVGERACSLSRLFVASFLSVSSYTTDSSPSFVYDDEARVLDDFLNRFLLTREFPFLVRGPSWMKVHLSPYLQNPSA